MMAKTVRLGSIACAALLALQMVLTAALMADEPQEDLRADLPSQARRSDPITHEVDFSAVVTPPFGCRVLKVWLPLPPSDEAQQISRRRLSTFPDEIEPQINVEPVYGNKFAYFEFRNPQGAQIIRHRFTAKVWELDWELNPDRVRTVATWPQPFQPYLQSQPISRQAELDQLLANLVPERRSPAEDLFRVMNWIDSHLEYDHANASLQADANHAFEQRRGHCSDYHGLCATMGRKLGYPARVTYGLVLSPKNSPSHCKLEVFLPPYGWVSFDLSETQKLMQSIAKDVKLSAADKERFSTAALRRLHSGYRENSWLLLTKGTGYELAPKASQRVGVVRTIYAEADGQPLPEPDPANPHKREFAWMTVHKYSSDKAFKLPFKDLATLESEAD